MRSSLSAYMRLYPKATLRDIYKNCFQDRFGPGHLVQDTARSGAYLREELATSPLLTGAYIEPCGWRGDYVRVNLSVLQQGLLTYDQYFDAFVRSVNSIQPPSVKEWAKEWHDILRVINDMKIDLQGYEADRQEIEQLLMEGKYVIHHSLLFEELYRPHYRIMSRKIVEKEFPKICTKPSTLLPSPQERR